MQISYNWLKKHATLPGAVTAKEVAEKLKLSTVEVEGIIEQGKDLENVVVGKVLTAEKHPNADKLKVCQVDVGETITIVCGGSNVVAGMLVAVAKNGAKVKWHGEGDLIELKPTSIRGVESNGMICGADEIGLVERFPKHDEKEIVDLTSFNYKAGTPLREALGLSDATLEIDNKSLSNRPDLWGHYGIAREVAVLTGREVLPYKVKDIKNGSGIDLKVSVGNKTACPKYNAVALSGIKIGPSPAWLAEALASVGVRSINNIVDATNFVMFDLGQPLHAFDAKAAGNSIMVRNARADEKIVTLDGKERSLTDDMLVIANLDNALAIAGVMGGSSSAVTDATTDIIIESANFDAVSIRKTSTRLGLRTDASARFEKSLDPNLTDLALKRMVELVLEVSPGAKVSSKVVEVGKPVLFTGPLTVPVATFEHKIGSSISAKTIITILTRLGFGVKEKKDTLIITIPTWRATKDISRAEDLVEEVVRIVGYDTVSASLPNFSITPPEHHELLRLTRTLQDVLANEFSFAESYNYSFISAQQIEKMGDGGSNYVELDNPLSKERPFLRRSLLPNLLENLAKNADYPRLSLFEIGKVFVGEEGGQRAEKQSDQLLPRQDTWFTAVFSEKKNQEPFKNVRQVMERLSEITNIDFQVTAPQQVHNWQHPSRAADIRARGVTIGAIYEVHPQVLEKYGVENRVGVLEFNLNQFAAFPLSGKKYQIFSPYPSIIRDIAFVVTSDVEHGRIVIKLSNVSPLITSVELFDIYRGSNLGAGLKSMAYHLTYNSKERTLTAEEVDLIQKTVEETLIKNFKAEIRK